MKKFRFMLAMIVAVVFFGAFGMASVKAVSASITNSTTNHAITLSRTVTGVTNKVSVNFTYTVTAASTNPSGATGMPTTGSVSFSNVTPSNDLL